MRGVASINRNNNKKIYNQYNTTNDLNIVNKEPIQLENIKEISTKLKSNPEMILSIESKFEADLQLTKEMKQNQSLTMRNIPIVYWGIGVLLTIFGLLFMVNMILYKNDYTPFLKILYKSEWWEILILILFILIGFSLFLTANYEKITIDKYNQTVIFSKYHLIFCRKFLIQFRISDIIDVFPYKLGYRTVFHGSYIYKTGFRLRNSKKINMIYMFKSVFQWETIRNVLKIKNYLYDNDYFTYDLIKESIIEMIEDVNI